jgi:hypothetical protein
MLVSPEYLSIIIEFSIGLAGFSAIVSVFLHGSNELPKIDKHRVTSLLSFALIPGFTALSCIGLELTLQDIDSATRISSGLLSIALTALIAFSIIDRRSMARDQLALTQQGFRASFFITIIAAVVLAQLCGILGLIESPPTFFFGLVSILLLGVVQFTRILLLRRANED